MGDSGCSPYIFLLRLFGILCYIREQRGLLEMTTTTMTIRMDAELKREADTLCKEMGMTLSTAFNIFAKEMVRKRGIPFAITGKTSLYDEPNRSHLLDAMNELNAGHGEEHGLVD